MRKSILIIGNHPPPFGGVPTHIQYLAPYLSSRGWDVHILSFTGNRRGVEHIGGYFIYRPPKLVKWSKLLSPFTTVPTARKFRSFAYTSPKEFLSHLGITKLAKDIVVRNDIKLISAYHLLGAGFAGALISEELSIPLVTTVFGEIYSAPDFHKRRLAEIAHVVHTSKKLLSCSRHCSKSFRLIGLSPKVETVYYGIDTEKFSPKNDGTGIRSKLGISSDDKVVVFVGRMVRDMGLHTLLQSIPEVLCIQSKIKFVVVGSRGELLTSALTLRDRCRGNVFVIPDASFEELPLYYAASTVTVAPSINDRACLGIAIAEAMATGKPVIASKVGGTAEVVVDGETGILVPPENPALLRDAILGLINNHEAIVKMGRYARERAETVFDKNQTNRRMEQIFDECVT